MKKHFLFLGKAGLIYFSWLFLILFIGLIIAYESVSKFSWPAAITIVIFFIILIHTYFASYYTAEYLHLPYRNKVKLASEPKITWSWKQIKIEKVRLNKLQNLYLLRIKLQKKNGK